MILVGNVVEKMTGILQIFFDKNMKALKAAQKLSFIKNVPAEPFLAYICDMAQMSLPLRVGTTITFISGQPYTMHIFRLLVHVLLQVDIILSTFLLAVQK